MRVILIIIVLSLFVGGFLLGKKTTQYEFSDLIGKSQKYEQISSELASLQIDYQKQSDVLSKYEDELSYRTSGTVVSISKSNFGIKGKTFLDNENKEKVYEIYLPDGDKKGPPIGYVMFEKQISSRVYDHDIEIVQGVERDPKTGRFKVLARGFFVLKENDKSIWKDKKFALPITGGSVTVDPEFGEVTKKKIFFKPRITAGVEWLKKDVMVSGMVYPISYGMNPDFSDFRFLGTGLSGNHGSGLHVIVSPVSMNLNKIIKPLHNTYLGPVIDFDSKAKFGVGAVLQLGL